MRQLRTIALTLALVAAACGGGDSADTTAGDSGGTDTTVAGDDDSNGSNAGAGSDPAIMSTTFDLADLPDDFPAELIPPSWTAGQATDILGPFAVNFESDMDFADVVAHYDGILGASNPIVGDPGEQLAQWTEGPIWLAQVFDGDPLIIGFVSLTE